MRKHIYRAPKDLDRNWLKRVQTNNTMAIKIAHTMMIQILIFKSHLSNTEEKLPILKKREPKKS